MRDTQEEYDRHFRALELEPGATVNEVRKAYAYLKDLYSRDSLPIASLKDVDFSEERRQEILEEIEEAYSSLIEALDQKRHAVEEVTGSAPGGLDVNEEISRISKFSGASLRHIREKLGVELYDIGNATKIHTPYLENIELEKFNLLPEEIYMKGYLTAYAKHLSLDAARVVSDYMERYRDWKENKP
jgi:hypothetical protein